MNPLGVLMGSFEGTAAPPWLLDAVRDGLGGVLLFAQNVVDDDQVAALCAQLHAARHDVVVAIDEEGGDVTRLDAARGSDTPSPAAFGFVDDVGATTEAYADLGVRLARLGVDLTLAPVADVNSEPRNPVIGVRSFGDSPQLVARHVVAAVDGFHAGGVAACAKHFPGHGDTTADTHLGAARVAAPFDVLAARELVPFSAAVAAGVDAVLTAHVVADALDGAPASLSAAWTRHLRQAMGFDGVVITDALDMAAVAGGRGICGIADAAVRALAAGADLLCLGSNFDAATTATVVERVDAAIAGGRLDAEAVDRSTGRIAALARRRAANPCGDGAGRAACRVAERAVTVTGTIPAGPFAVVECRPAPSMACFNVAWGLSAVLGDRDWPVEPVTSDHPVPALPGATVLPVVVVVRDADAHTWQHAVVDHCLQARPTVVVELGWPSSRRWEAPASIVSHGAARISALAVLDVLEGKS